MRFFQTAIRRGPAGLRKDWLYTNLKPMVDALEEDLKDAQEAEIATQQPQPAAVEQLPQEPAKEQPQAEAEAVKEEPAKKAEKKDLGDNPKKPARKGKK